MAKHSKAENAADYNHLPLDALIAGAITRVDRILRMFHVCSHAGRDARHSAEPGLEGAYALRQRLSAGNEVYEALRLSKAARSSCDSRWHQNLLVFNLQAADVTQLPGVHGGENEGLLVE